MSFAFGMSIISSNLLGKISSLTLKNLLVFSLVVIKNFALAQVA
jgi:hypothetical protein